ncbi:hypothetical protein DT075_03605 [Bacillus licheniformis]|nr:hypothetical protein DT075_03605 [Bacillus licheniformis]
MEDAATAEISRAQLWQWIRHPKGVLDDGRKVTAEMVKMLREDKEREVKDGHDGTWIAHPGMIQTALDVFNQHMPSANQIHRKRKDVKVEEKDLLEVPKGRITEAFKKFRNRDEVILPDRSAVTMTVPNMRAYSLLAIQTCHKRNVHAIGGMAAQIPAKDKPEINEAAFAKYHLEARLWNDVFVYAQNDLRIPQGTIKATVLVETILAAFEMDEILYELKEHSAGLNCGRWDYIFSF